MYLNTSVNYAGNYVIFNKKLCAGADSEYWEMEFKKEGGGNCRPIFCMKLRFSLRMGEGVGIRLYFIPKNSSLHSNLINEYFFSIAFYFITECCDILKNLFVSKASGSNTDDDDSAVTRKRQPFVYLPSDLIPLREMEIEKLGER